MTQGFYVRVKRVKFGKFQEIERVNSYNHIFSKTDFVCDSVDLQHLQVQNRLPNGQYKSVERNRV